MAAVLGPAFGAVLARYGGGRCPRAQEQAGDVVTDESRAVRARVCGLRLDPEMAARLFVV
jgi:hypothetical protein